MINRPTTIDPILVSATEQMSKRIEWIITQFAVTRLGAVLVPLNIRLRSVDISHMLRDSGSVALITQHSAEGFNYIDLVLEVLKEVAAPTLSA